MQDLTTLTTQALVDLETEAGAAGDLVLVAEIREELSQRNPWEVQAAYQHS